MGGQGLMLLIGLKNFDHHDLTAKHCYFGCSRSPGVDGIKIFDKGDQAAKIGLPS